jgi:hypothetical protein
VSEGVSEGVSTTAAKRTPDPVKVADIRHRKSIATKIRYGTKNELIMLENFIFRLFLPKSNLAVMLL